MSHSVVDDTAVVEIEDSSESDEADELVSESLVEEVSIDGMCGVY
ncbi:MAG: mycofactocin precursor [Geodermatophilaceae bacterium]|nr:mycofactocin precursor [Geodermatophilaceae bacterium]